MLKEVVLKFYLLLVKEFFRLFSYFPLKRRTVMLSSFGDNLSYINDSLYHKGLSDVIVLKESSCKKDFKHAQKVLKFSPKHPLSFFTGLYYLATSKMIFIDNYHVILASCDFKKDVVVSQVWHANGAVKYFGLRDKTIVNRPKSAHRRFRSVYKTFNKVVVSSDDMAYIFSEAFGLSDNNILKTGLARTDYYFDKKQVNEDRVKVRQGLNLDSKTKVILYAPTYRDGHLNDSQLPLNLKTVSEKLPGYHILVKLHPAMSAHYDYESDVVTNVSQGYTIESLMAASDILITDYSSIPFEYCILNKPMYFYINDIDEYQEERGIWFDFESYMPGPACKDEDSLIDNLLNETADLNKVKAFNKRVNKYADGHSSDRLVDTLYVNF